MTLVASYPGDARQALEHGALVFAGGLLATGLVLVPWRAHAHLPERAAIAKLYRELAAWVRGLQGADDRAPVLLALNQGRAAADDALSAVADALEACRWRADAESLRNRLDAPVDALCDELGRCSAAGEVDQAAELEAILRRAESIRGELRDGVDLATSWQGEGTPAEDPVRHKRSRRPELGVRPVWPILRANLTCRSSAFRHAVRLSATVALAATIYRVFGLPHGYWVPLTVLFVLRPDYGSTFTRGLQRYVGTALGAVLATLIAAALNPGPYTLAALATLLAVGIFGFMYANYALYTLSMTAWVVFTVSFGGLPEYVTAIDRLINTTIPVGRGDAVLDPHAEPSW